MRLECPPQIPCTGILNSERATSNCEQWRLCIKRCIDIIISGTLLVLLSPAFILVALLIRATSEGGALFRQTRVGANGVEFKMLKFRTMYLDKCSDQPAFDEKNDLLKRKGDPRITSLGRWLRRTSLDELPQLFNVFRGEMSLVGPRPLPQKMLHAPDEVLQIRSALKPGITGLWQIKNRSNNTSILHMLPYDLEYTAKLSLRRDALILLTTLAVVLRGDGAH